MRNIAVATVAVMSLYVVIPAGSASPWMPFKNTATHVERAKEVVIAECLADIGFGVNGNAAGEVTVVTVVKGDRKLGKMSLYSEDMKKGRTYLLTNFGSYSGKIDFATNGELAKVELPPKFDLESLKGKSPVEQVQSVFDARRKWVAGQLFTLDREMKSLGKSKLE